MTFEFYDSLSSMRLEMILFLCLSVNVGLLVNIPLFLS